MVFLFILLPIVVIVSVVAMIAAVARKEGENFERRIRSIYLYIVSFTTLIMIIGGLIGTIVSITDILLPSDNIYSGYTEQTREDLEYNSKIRIIKQGVEYAGVLIVSIPIYLYHSKKARELNEDWN